MAVDPALTDAERDRMRVLLQAERCRVERQVCRLERTFGEIVAAADLEPPDDEHDPDGTTAYERAQVSSMAATGRQRLTELERAIDAVDSPDFGRCDHCGRPIGAARMDAVPGTTRCVRCRALGDGDP